MSGRRGDRTNRRRIGAVLGGAALPPSTPLTIITSVVAQLWVRSDMGITTATGVSVWADQSGNGRDLSQGTGANQPVFSAADATINNKPSVTFDGVNDQLVSTAFALADPFWVWIVFKQLTWGANKRIWGSNQASNTPCAIQSGTTPNITQNAGSNSNSNNGGTLGSWFRGEFNFGASTSDYTKIGATTVTGASAGATSIATGVILAGTFTAPNVGNIAVTEFGIWNGLPTAPERAALDAYVTARYAAGLV